MRKTLLLGSVAAMAIGLTMTAVPANAAAGDTLVTFTVGIPTVPTLSISPGAFVPGLGGTGSGGTTYADGTIVSVVTDLRTTAGTWVDSVSSTSFGLVGATTPSGTALIPASSAKIFTPTTLVTIPGTATVTSHADLASAVTLSGTAAPLLSATTTNANITTLTHTLRIDTTDKAVGLYTGTVTQSVS
jgi:hypothetical protein